MNKPNCYECRYRGLVPGDAHSSCKHPDVSEAAEDPLQNVLAIFASVGRTSPVIAHSKLNVQGDEHGIRNGWFNWPWNFDPAWLISCEGFTPKKKGER